MYTASQYSVYCITVQCILHHSTVYTASQYSVYCITVQCILIASQYSVYWSHHSTVYTASQYSVYCITVQCILHYSIQQHSTMYIITAQYTLYWSTVPCIRYHSSDSTAQYSVMYTAQQSPVNVVQLALYCTLAGVQLDIMLTATSWFVVMGPTCRHPSFLAGRVQCKNYWTI